MLADSVRTGHRTAIYTMLYAAGILSLAGGQLVAAGIFALAGNRHASTAPPTGVSGFCTSCACPVRTSAFSGTHWRGGCCCLLM
jgi:hypothetical protein